MVAVLVCSPARASAAGTCGGTDAHAAHASASLGCSICHACAGQLVFSPITYPGGTTSNGATYTGSGAATTCTVGCHHPFGAQGPSVTWSAGPQACTACHSNVAVQLTQPTRSSHIVGSMDPTSACEGCHDVSQHTSGQVHIKGTGGSASSGCVSCHSGTGLTLAGWTPPLLVGWSDTVAGDFHGDRPGTCRFDNLDAAGTRTVGRGGYPCPSTQPALPNALRITSRWWYVSGLSGAWAWTCDIETVDASGARLALALGQPCPEGTTLNSACNNPVGDPDCYPVSYVTRGFGGTLVAPNTRGAGALPCTACHDFHASSNAFLLASQVNGSVVPASTIDRAGVGAQGLCVACHQGDRHEVCKTCHKEAWVTDGEYSWFEGAPVDPVPDGSACFYCHGHEGLRFMVDPSPAYPGGGHPFGIAGTSRDQNACQHCHGGWAPPATEYAAPTFSSAPTVTAVTATSATVSWATSELATTYVEYGLGTAGYVVGDAGFVSQHSVSLTGLTPSMTYVWRVRSSDRFRNFAETALQTFTTPGAAEVPRPDLAAVSAGATVGTYTITAQLPWYPVTAPSGTAVTYEVQLASDPDFTYLVDGSMAGGTLPGSTVADSGWVSGSPLVIGSSPALTYPATITNIPQDWCGDIVPAVYWWRVRARDAAGNVSQWSVPGTFGVFAGDPYC
jgi:hypothetical protein